MHAGLALQWVVLAMQVPYAANRSRGDHDLSLAAQKSRKAVA